MDIYMGFQWSLLGAVISSFYKEFRKKSVIIFSVRTVHSHH